MNTLILPLGILCGVILLGAALSTFAAWRAYGLLRELKLRETQQQAKGDSGVQALRETVDALAAQIHDLQQHPPIAPAPGLPKPGLNLSKRSHALRLHRRGENAQQIATALELPRQEVDLLLKVHGIVLSNV